MIVKHMKSEHVLGRDVKIVNTFIGRLIGLMFIKEMNGMDGLIIERCNSIHNCFVRFPIDVIFLSNDNRIIKIIRKFRPWRFSWIYFSAKRVLELPGGTIPEHVTKGDYLEVSGV